MCCSHGFHRRRILSCAWTLSYLNGKSKQVRCMRGNPLFASEEDLLVFLKYALNKYAWNHPKTKERQRKYL